MKYGLEGIFSVGTGRQSAIPRVVSRRRKLSACVAAAVVGVSLIAAQDANAAGSRKGSKHKAPSIKVADKLELENALLREQLEAVQRERDLLRQGAIAPGAAVPAPAVEQAAPNAEAIDSAQTVAKQEAEENNDLGEVVVKARPRLAKLKEVPSSSSVRTGQELSRELAIDLGSILQRAGNVKWNNGNSRTSSLSIRGVGQQAQTDAMDPSVGTVVDGVPYAYNPLTSFDHYDIDQVEVDRGPQGTDGGKNFSMGRVNISTRRPSFTPDANYSLTYGRYDTYIADAAGGGAVVDNLLAWRGAIHVNKAQGVTENLYNSDQTWYNRDRVAGRLQFLLTPTEDFSARVSIDVQPRGAEFFNGNSFFTPTPQFYANGDPNPLKGDASTRLGRRWFKDGNPDYTYQDSYLYGGGQHAFNQDNQFPLVTASKGGLAELNWNIGGFKLTSITGVRDYEFQARNDEGTPFDVSKNGGGSVPDFLQVSEELKVSSSFGKLVDYTAGVYLLERKQTKGNKVGFGSDAGAWFASDKAYATLDQNGAGQQLMSDSLNGLETNNPYYIYNQTGALFANAKWHITEPLTLTTGLRFSSESRSQTTEKYITQQGFGSALNPGVITTVLGSVDTGGFGTDKDGNLTSAALADPTQLALANSVAAKYFGIADYSALSELDKSQVAAAKTIRAGTNGIGQLWGLEPGRPFKSTQPGYVVSPSYKINENLTSYVSWQYQEKAGFSQTVNAVAFQAAAEKTNSYEIGLKSSLFDNTLTLNTDFFWTDISNYQQAVYVTNYCYPNCPSASDNYVATTGNAPGVRALGVEVDGSYTGIPYTAINFSGSYNDAIYTDFKNLANPAENGNNPNGTAFFDATGQTLPGAAKFTFSVSPEVRLPIEAFGRNEFHTSFTSYFTDSYKSDVSLSNYSWINANITTDFAIGVGRRDKLFDISFVAKNLFNNQTPYAKTWNSYTPGIPQWFGVMVSGKI